MGIFKKIIAEYNDALGTDCKNYAIQINLGIELYKRFEPQKAIVCYERAFELQPDKHLAWTALAKGFYNLERHEKAIYCYEQALKIHPDDYESWCHKGVALFDLGRFNDALDAFDKAVEIQSELHEAWYNRGMTLLKLGRLVEAIDSLKHSFAHRYLTQSDSS